VSLRFLCAAQVVLAHFRRLNGALQNKYLLSAYRTDGSSLFDVGKNGETQQYLRDGGI
jgi:hypothetical protein